MSDSLTSNKNCIAEVGDEVGEIDLQWLLLIKDWSSLELLTKVVSELVVF